jgi:Ca2+-binding EF-hand superfamily protein
MAAEAGQWGTRQRIRYEEMDTNNDGVITRAEWRGSAQAFRDADWNNDGILSGDEVRLDNSRYGRGESADVSWTSASFNTLDTNGDGRISEREWRGDLETFRRVDQNRDGVLTRSEFLGQTAVGNASWDRFEALDTNNDGRIERREWRRNLNTFDSLDRNGDGVLTEREFLDQTTGTGIAGNRASRQTVTVDGRQTWSDTGLVVRAGDTVIVHADGTIQLSDNSSDVSEPGGARSGRRAPNAPIANAPAGALIARIGDSAAILLGANGTIDRAPVTGRLYLGINDDYFQDNAGEFRATVEIDRDRR